MTDTPLPLPAGLRWIKLVCRLGRLAHDGADTDDKPDLLPTAGKVRLSSSPARLRVQEADGRWRSVSLDEREYTIRADGELVDTEGRVGVWIPDPASALLDPRPYTLVATVIPTVGERWGAKLTGENLPDVVDLVAHSETVAIPASAVPGLSSRIAALEGILADGDGAGFPDGAVPIFETLAQAEAWEASNPGRVALTLEAAAEPDTTPPTLGTLTVTPDGTTATAQVTGATDDRGHVEYSFRLDSGTWTPWQTSPQYEVTGLSLSTDYTLTHRVRDGAGNVVEGYAVEFTTLAEDLWGTAWTDSFDGDGPLNGRTHDGLTWAVPDPIDKRWWDITEGLPATSGGKVNNPHYSANAGDEQRSLLSYASETGALRLTVGFGGTVELPTVPTRVRLRMTISSSSRTGAVFPVLWGTGPTHFTTLGGQATGFSGARIDGGEATTGLEFSIGSIDEAALKALGEYVYEVEATQTKVDFYRDGALISSATIADPSVAWHNGPRFGFTSVQSNAANRLDILDFSIRWE